MADYTLSVEKAELVLSLPDQELVLRRLAVESTSFTFILNSVGMRRLSQLSVGELELLITDQNASSKRSLRLPISSTSIFLSPGGSP